MSTFPLPETGLFCWVELHTPDPGAAQKFYGALLGWTFQEAALPEGPYVIAKVGDKQVAGMLPLGAPAGTPPHWGVYVAVDDVKASTEAAARLGAHVVMGATTMGPGTFSVLQDPAGGTFMLWHTTAPMGPFLYGEPGALTWNELLSTNVDLAQRFYTQLFGWKADPQPMAGITYTVFQQGEVPVGGLIPQQMKGAPSVWASYFAVADADATFATATKLGATVLMPLTDLPGVGRFGWLQDPQGAVFGVIKNATP
jgi:predicted enzyme related to lactoylglutathione lyase